MFNGKVIQDVAVEAALKELDSAIQAVSAKVPATDLPTSAGNYKLTVAVDSGVVSYSWSSLS